jgi:purine catabolism regulator
VLSLETSRPAAAGDDPLRAAALEALLEGRPASPHALLTAAGFDDLEPVSLVAFRDAAAIGIRRSLATYAEARPLLQAELPPGLRVALVEPAGVDRLVGLLPPGTTIVESPPATVRRLPALLPLVLTRLRGASPGERIRLLHDPSAVVTADPAVRAAVDPWLTALQEYDDAHGADLLPSLAAYLRHHGSWDPAAQELGVHRHTLRQRVIRAAEVAGFELADPRHRALLVLGLDPDR